MTDVFSEKNITTKQQPTTTNKLTPRQNGFPTLAGRFNSFQALTVQYNEGTECPAVCRQRVRYDIYKYARVLFLG